MTSKKNPEWTGNVDGNLSTDIAQKALKACYCLPNQPFDKEMTTLPQ